MLGAMIEVVRSQRGVLGLEPRDFAQASLKEIVYEISLKNDEI